MPRRRSPLFVIVVVVALLAIVWVGRCVVSGWTDGPEVAPPSDDDGAAEGGSDPDDPWNRPRRVIRHVGLHDVDPAAIPVGSTIVEGTVRDATTQQPVAGAQVGFWNRTGETVTEAGPDGHYRLDMPLGTFSCGATDGTDRMSPPQRVQISTHTLPVDFVIDRISHVHGHVRDPGGRPVAGVEVSYDHVDRAVREAFDASLGRVVATGPDGSFRLPVLPGEVRLRASARGKLGHKVIADVPRGADVEVDVRLQDLVSIDGRVVDDHGAPVANATVSAFVGLPDIDLTGTRDTTTDASGRWKFTGLNPGTLTISARTEDGAMTHDVPLMELDHGDVHDLVLTMAAVGTVHGRAVYTDGKPAPGARITAKRVGYNGTWAQAQADGDGRFDFNGPVDGTFDILAELDNDSGRAQSVPVEKPTEVIMRTPGGLRGTVHAGKQVLTDFVVTIDRWFPIGGERESGRAPATQRFLVPDGRFEWAHLEIGSYELTITAPGYAPLHIPAAVVEEAKWTELDVPLVAPAPAPPP